MTYSQIIRLCPGTPLRLDGEQVFLRSARISPATGTPLAVVADIAGGTFAAEVEHLSRDNDEPADVGSGYDEGFSNGR